VRGATWVLAVLGVLAASPALAGVQTAWYANARIRLEARNALSADAALDPSYAFWNGRVRAGVRLSAGKFLIEGTGQGAASLSLPEDGSSGPGAATYAINENDTAPYRFSLLELNALYQGSQLDVRAGRMSFKDGNERAMSVDRLNDIKVRRLTERLVGAWDWSNVGRRFDGVDAGLSLSQGRVDVMYLVPLAGGLSYDEADTWIDDYQLFGVSFINQFGSESNGAEMRFSAYQALDDRPVLRSDFWEAPGSDLNLTTAVLSIILGGVHNDVLFWIAFQSGDWGNHAQDGLAFVAEVGWRFSGDWDPALRLGYEQASGWDGRDVKHTTFYNMLPSNHRYYGISDLNAFQNLRDVRMEISVEPNPRLTARLTGYGLWLVHQTDAWYGGSGPYNDDDFGYVARRPAGGGDFSGANIGVEIDCEFSLTLRGRNKIEAGGAGFWGAKVAEETFPDRSNDLSAYLQLTGAI